jgi:hypothetical protein
LAVAAVTVFYAIKWMGALWDPNSSFAFAALPSFSFCSIAAVTMWFGVRLLAFARSGQDQPRIGLDGAILLGIGSFLPGFIVSLPFTAIWSRYEWPGDGQAGLGAMVVSVYIGIGVAVISSAVLLRKQIWIR